MWFNEECLIVGFLQNLQSGFTKTEYEPDIPIDVQPSFTFQRPEPTIPEDIKNATPESLASEYIAFLETEFPDSEPGMLFGNFQLFLETKNLIDRWGLPAELRLKLEKAQILAREEIRKRVETEKKLRLETEKGELPSLVNRCCDWAITKGMNRVTVADVDAFILENEFDLLQETRRALYAMANVQLKSRK
jgi:hypothetical protein